MSEHDPNLNQEQEQAQEQPSFTPASFEKRTAAWMGLAYMLIILFAITFSIFTGGKSLPGTAPLLLVPVAVAVVIIAIYRQRKGTAPGGLPLTIITLILCAVALFLGVVLGIPPLVDALRHAFA